MCIVFLSNVVYVIIIIIISISISIIIVAFIFTMLENLECALEGSPPLHFLAVGCTSQKSGGSGDLQKYLPTPCGGARKAGKHRLTSSEVQRFFRICQNTSELIGSATFGGSMSFTMKCCTGMLSKCFQSAQKKSIYRLCMYEYIIIWIKIEHNWK